MQIGELARAAGVEHSNDSLLRKGEAASGSAANGLRVSRLRQRHLTPANAGGEETAQACDIGWFRQLSMMGLLPDMSPREIKFQTERTRKFRDSALSAEDERTISHLEEFGCSVVNVKRSNYGLGWAYTVGVFDTSGRPEIITVGLLPETAYFALNEAAKLLQAGVDLTKGRHRNLIGQVDCEFRPVDPKWVEHLMGWALWYYDGDDFPVIQAVYPDLQNRFPEDEGFDKSFERPLMQPDAPMTRTENDFWASADPKSSLFNRKFGDSPHSEAFLSEKVDRGTEPITFVSHDAEDGAWQFLGDSMFEGRGVVVCLHHPIDGDPTLTELADLPVGWYAERDAVGEPWIRK